MKKKNYMKPQTDIFQAVMPTLLAGSPGYSVDNSGVIDIQEEDTTRIWIDID